MIIIVEGIDKSGKSTLIKDLTRYFDDAVVLKLSEYYKPREGDPQSLHNLEVAYDELFNQARQISYDQHKHVIFDRAYPSELVYSQVMRNYEAWDNNFWWELDKGLGRFGHCLFVYVRPPDGPTHQDRLRSEGESYINGSHVRSLLSRYDRFLNESSLRKVVIDGGNRREDNLAEVLKHIK